MYIYKMNKMVRAKVDTPIGLTEEFELTEIVRQGTVCAVDLCGVSTDKINRIGLEEPKLVVSGVEIQHPVFVDDMLGIGSAPMIERMEPKMRFLEDTKKFTYNTDEGKSEIMEIQINPKRKEERPIVKVKKGAIRYTDKYKYLGDMYDKTGKNMSKIQSKTLRSPLEKNDEDLALPLDPNLQGELLRALSSLLRPMHQSLVHWAKQVAGYAAAAQKHAALQQHAVAASPI